jgi:redox-sensitive bicupin YhaK (pirin superfamily)
MRRFVLGSAILAGLISILLFTNPKLTDITTSYFNSLQNYLHNVNITHSPTEEATHTYTDDHQSMSSTARTMAKSLRQAKITPHRSGTRGHSDHGWLNTYHSFSFADWYDPRFSHFGSLRVLNEDRVAPQNGFPTHPHRNFEIFSYIISGELTHRDSMITRGKEGDAQSDKFYRMHRGDVQFTTGGTGIAHSETNEHKSDTVHFLQIWALPWKQGLTPRYHTRHFDDEEKKKGFVKILSPLKGGDDATAQQEKDAEPTIPDTIPIHADFVMGAGIISPSNSFEWIVGAKGTQGTKRKVYIHLPMTKKGKAKIRLDGREDAELSEGDGAFIEGVNADDKLVVESIGEADAEVIVLDTA